MQAGSMAALAKTSDRNLSQAWSRYFHENPQIYSAIDGIRYCNAHNDEDAVALYERAETALSCNQVMRLDHPQLRAGIQQVARDHNMIFVP